MKDCDCGMNCPSCEDCEDPECECECYNDESFEDDDKNGW
jgi:hypothetical protein